jgi:hypothetical protein
MRSTADAGNAKPVEAASLSLGGSGTRPRIPATAPTEGRVIVDVPWEADAGGEDGGSGRRHCRIGCRMDEGNMR